MLRNKEGSSFGMLDDFVGRMSNNEVANHLQKQCWIMFAASHKKDFSCCELVYLLACY